MSEAPDNCPLCLASFDGGPIPENLRQYYSEPYRWSLKIGIVENDRVVRWKCPECGHEWPR